MPTTPPTDQDRHRSRFKHGRKRIVIVKAGVANDNAVDRIRCSPPVVKQAPTRLTVAEPAPGPPAVDEPSGGDVLPAEPATT